MFLKAKYTKQKLIKPQNCNIFIILYTVPVITYSVSRSKNNINVMYFLWMKLLYSKQSLSTTAIGLQQRKEPSDLSIDMVGV